MYSQLLRLFARISAGLLVVHLFGFWAAERQGTFLGFGPEHFSESALIFALIAGYLLWESALMAREDRIIAEEVISVESEGEESSAQPRAFSAPTTAMNPYVVSAIIIGLALIVGGVVLSKPKGAPAPSAGAPAPSQAGAPQAQPPAPGQKVDVKFGTTPIVNKNAKVVLIEFGDFECPFCGRWFTDSYTQIKKEYIDTGKIAFQHRDYPLPFHAKAQKASEAARCALAQSEKLYWDLHDWMYQNQTSIDVDTLKAQAKKLGVNATKFDQCLDGGTTAAAVKTDYDEGTTYGVSGTPSFFVNGELIVGAQPFATFKQKIDAALAAAK